MLVDNSDNKGVAWRELDLVIDEVMEGLTPEKRAEQAGIIKALLLVQMLEPHEPAWQKYCLMQLYLFNFIDRAQTQLLFNQLGLAEA